MDEEDIEISPWPVQTGQVVGVSVGVRVIHKPTGILAIVNHSRSQHINRAIALDMIESALTHPRFTP